MAAIFVSQTSIMFFYGCPADRGGKKKITQPELRECLQLGSLQGIIFLSMHSVKEDKCPKNGTRAHQDPLLSASNSCSSCALTEIGQEYTILKLSN